jgi:hypothetical protein
MSHTLTVPKVVPIEVAKRMYEDLEALSPIVRQCEKEHGEYHKWVDIVVDYQDVTGSLVPVSICGRCYVRRCDASVLEPDKRCIWPVHHRRPHRDTEHKWREVGK